MSVVLQFPVNRVVPRDESNDVVLSAEVVIFPGCQDGAAQFRAGQNRGTRPETPRFASRNRRRHGLTPAPIPTATHS